MELIVKAFKTASEQRLLRLFVDVVKNTGHTFEQRLLGTSGIDTIDPVNLEAVLSKQFDGMPSQSLVGDLLTFKTRLWPWRTSFGILPSTWRWNLHARW